MAAPAEKSPVDIIITPIIKRLHLTGCSLGNYNIKTRIRWYFLFISFVTWFVLVCCCGMEATTVEDACDSVLNASLLLQGLGAILTVRKFHNVILETVDSMKKVFWFHEDEMEATILTKHRLIYRILSNIDLSYVSFCYAAVVLFNLEPLYHGDGKFPLDMSFPYRNFIKESPYFEIIYFILSFSTIVGGGGIAFLDSLNIVTIGFVLIQVDLIKHKLKKLTSGIDGEKEMYEKLKKCIAHHNVVLNSLKKIEESFRYTTLVKLLSDMLALTSTTYLLTQQISLNFKFLTIYGICCIQPLLYCFFGEFVTSECASIGEEAYAVNWEKFGYKSVTSGLSLMIQRSQKPVYMTAGGMIMFSLPNYVAFMKMMVSFFLVLKRS